jgi:hypothetical protein
MYLIFDAILEIEFKPLESPAEPPSFALSNKYPYLLPSP